MRITPLPPAPSRDDPANFSDRADAFLPAIGLTALQMNALADEMAADAGAAAASAATALGAPGTSATSRTSLTIGTGSKTVVIQPGKFFVRGMFVTVAFAGGPSNWMVGWVENYNDETGVMMANIAVFNGAGTQADWVVSISAPLSFEPATAAQIFAGVSNAVGVTPAGLRAAQAPVLIPFAPAITLNGLTFINADIGDLTANFSLPSPINMPPGGSGRIRFRQDGVGGRTGSFGAAWDFAAGLVPIFSTTPGAIDELHYFVNSANSVSAALRKGVA